MNAGKLNIPFRIEEPAQDVDAHGQLSVRWTRFVNGWARRDVMRGDEEIISQTSTASEMAVFETRWRPGIVPNMRLIDTRDDQVWNIRSAIDRDGKRRELRLICERVVV